MNESKRRGEENIQRDDNSAGESVARKYAACSVVELAVPSLIVTHILGRTRARPTTAASANLSTSPECFTAPVRLLVEESLRSREEQYKSLRKVSIKVSRRAAPAVEVSLTQLKIVN